MGPAKLRAHCLSHLGAVEDFPFGPEVSVFKVAGKMFALSRLQNRPLSVSLKCDPELAVSLRASYPEVQPGYHLNKRHWNTLTLGAGLPDKLVLHLIEDSYDLVVDGLPKRIRNALTRSLRCCAWICSSASPSGRVSSCSLR